MIDIIKIVIKGASGYCRSDEAYNDKVTITPASIAYEYIPVKESGINPKRKWSYKTNSPKFHMIKQSGDLELMIHLLFIRIRVFVPSEKLSQELLPLKLKMV